MVKYYGRAKTITGSSTDQKGFNMSGAVSSVGHSNSVQRYINRRVNSLAGVCGFPTQNGSSWRQSLKNKHPYCRNPASKCLAAAGGVGRKHNSYYKTPKSGEKGCGHKTTCSRETEVLWNSVENELIKYVRSHIPDSKYPDAVEEFNARNFKMALVGVSEAVRRDLELTNSSDAPAHFIKFFDHMSLLKDASKDASTDTSLYDDLSPELQKQIDKLNKLSFTNVGKRYIEADKKNEYHICALVSEHARNALKAKHYGGEVHLDKNACSWSVKAYYYCDPSCCGQSNWTCGGAGCGVHWCR